MMLDDDDLRGFIEKKLDAKRRPAIAAFVNARLSGVSISAMEKLRFASIWTPGH